jgi:hypothetical protein
LAKIARRLGSIRILFTVCSGITLIPVYRSITEKQRTLYTGYAAMAFLFSFFPGSWNVVRQYMAVGIVCYAYKFIFTKELKKYILCIIAAAVCHESAIIMIPVYFLWSKDGDLISRGKIWAICIMLIVISINLSFVLGGHLGGGLEKYEGYLEGGKAGKNRDFFLNIFEILVILYFMKALSKIDKRNKLYFLMLIFQCVMGISGFKSPYIKRIGVYFGITEIFLVGALPRAIKRTLKDKRLSRTFRVMIVVYILAKFWFVDYYLNQPKIIPYKWKFPEGLF